MSLFNRRLVFTVVALLVAALLLLLARCRRRPSVTQQPKAPASATPGQISSGSNSLSSSPTAPEVLSPATIDVPASIGAGTLFTITWTGPDNVSDYITIVRKDAPDAAVGPYAITRGGSRLPLTAPIEPGDKWEVRYVTGRSHKVLGRSSLLVTATAATLEAADSVGLDSPLSIAWTGPDNAGDFITFVPRTAADRTYGAYALTNKGSPLTVIAPPTVGEGEIRYVTGQGGKIIARRTVKITRPNVTLNAPSKAIAGADISVAWTGPANEGDYLTVVPQTSPDGHHANYTTLSGGSPAILKLPMETGDAELRYMTGRGAKVIGRQPIQIVAAEVSLSAAPSAPLNSLISVTWLGPANEGDYLTLVPRGAPDVQHGPYTLTNQGSPLKISALNEPGDAELRYISGQGGKVLSRRIIVITP